MSAVVAKPAMMVRRFVPNDHECLFTAFAYLCEGSRHGAAGQRLRKVCADKVASDPDMFSEPVLGMPNAQYVDWIQNPFNWGGENEIGILAQHFDVEVAVVFMEAGFVLPYQFGGTKGRIYLIYTGQHYDPMVGAESEDAPVDGEVKLFPIGSTASDEDALECARIHARIAAEKASQRVVKKLKCAGCGAIVDDNDAFQVHCMEVEHDDDFSFMCEEVEIVEAGDDPTPEGRIDLSSPDVHTFYNTAEYGLAPLFPAPITIDGAAYPTLEHFWMAMKFTPTGGGEAAEGGATIPDMIRAADSLAALSSICADAEGSERGDWDEVKESLLLTGLRGKFAQHEALLAELQATGDKTIVLVDPNKWTGMSAVGGIPTGKNRVGELLMQVRAEMKK